MLTLLSVGAGAAAAASVSVSERRRVRGGHEGRAAVRVSAPGTRPPLRGLRGEGALRQRRTHGAVRNTVRHTAGAGERRRGVLRHPQEAFVSTLDTLHTLLETGTQYFMVF
jgi:hypothetical protein